VSFEVELPDLSAETEYATVLRWLKCAGDPVTAGEALVEVEADKANHEIEAPVSGRLAEVVAVEGDEIKTGSTLAIIETE
jgi:2-oxoglutarate dehydrogenase E2 component (dihydrolipoamide succinyltransferase)